MDFDLSKLVNTIQERDTLTRDIDILRDSLYRSGERSFENMINKSVRTDLANYLKTLGLSAGRQAPSEEKIKAALEELENNIKKMPIARLTIAFEPSAQLVSKLTNYMRDFLGNNIILDLHVDSSIVAGVILEFDGKYIDKSIKKQLEEAVNEIL